MSFTFKQFKIEHDEEVFKFGTDAAVIGSWVKIPAGSQVLEIGTGSGVITFMLAQRSPESNFTGIDFSEKAISLSNNNLNSFTLSKNIEFLNTSIQEFKTERKFDFIVSNPPFFEDSTKSPYIVKNQTRHTDTLSLFDLINYSNNLLSEEGKFTFIYPSRYLGQIKEIATTSGLFIHELIHIRGNSRKPVKRVLVTLAKKMAPPNERTICIYKDNGEYSNDLYPLLKPYYLKL